MTGIVSLKELVGLYLKNSSYMKEDAFENEINNKAKNEIASAEGQKEIIEIIAHLEEFRKGPDVSVKRMILMLSMLSFSIVL